MLPRKGGRTGWPNVPLTGAAPNQASLPQPGAPGQRAAQAVSGCIGLAILSQVALCSVPNVQDAHRGLVVRGFRFEDGEQYPTSAAPAPVQQLPDLLLVPIVLPRRGAATRKLGQRGDGRQQPIVPRGSCSR